MKSPKYLSTVFFILFVIGITSCGYKIVPIDDTDSTTKSSEEQKSESENKNDTSEESEILTFEIGDIVLIDGEPQGIVFYVDNDKTSGKILSLDYELTQFCGLYTKACSSDYGYTIVSKSSSSYGQENFEIWTRELPDFTGNSYYNAWYWCKYIKGLDWYIPARNEIKDICANLEKINTATAWLNSNGWTAKYFTENLTWSSTPRSLNTSYDPYRLTMYFSSSTASMLCNETKFHCHPVRLFSNTINGIGKIKVTPHTHDFSQNWSKDDNYHWHACNGCETIKDKAAHTWDDGVITTAATCVTTGLIKYTCTVKGCGATKTEIIEKKNHQYGDWVITKEPTEQEEGEKKRVCSLCHEEETASIDKLEHIHTLTQTWGNDEINHWHECTSCGEKTDIGEHTWTIVKEATVFEPGEANCICSVCGKDLNKRVVIPRLFCESPIDCTTGQAATKQSSKIYFGDFPRTIVKQNDDESIFYGKDNTTVITIDETESNSIIKGNFTYYLGSDGEYYAKVVEYPNSREITYSDGSTPRPISQNKTRWFRVEPIKWKILTTEYDIDYTNTDNTDTACLLFADEVLTAAIFYYESSKNHRNGKYASNYEHSQMRAYLNGIAYNAEKTADVNQWVDKGFIQTAFTQKAQDLILLTKVKNDGESTIDVDHIESSMANGYLADGITKSGYADYTCPATNDKIFLLSIQEATTHAYGFPDRDTAGTAEDAGRIRIATDFAIANRANQSNYTSYYGADWFTRTPSDVYFDMVRTIGSSGKAEFIQNIKDTWCGIAPAMTINLP